MGQDLTRPPSSTRTSLLKKFSSTSGTVLLSQAVAFTSSSPMTQSSHLSRRLLLWATWHLSIHPLAGSLRKVIHMPLGFYYSKSSQGSRKLLRQSDLLLRAIDSRSWSIGTSMDGSSSMRQQRLQELLFYAPMSLPWRGRLWMLSFLSSETAAAVSEVIFRVNFCLKGDRICS